MQPRLRTALALAAAGLLLAHGAKAAPVPERAASPALAHSATLSYQLYTIGFHPLDFTVQLSLEDGRYDIAVRGETKGLVDFFLRWVSDTVAEGRLIGHRPMPLHLRSLNRFHGNPRRVTIDYTSGVLVAEIDPPPTNDDRDPVTPEMEKDTIDPISAVLDLVQRVAHGEGCRASERVFDGRRRFDIMVSDAGMHSLEPNRRTPYQGMAQVCDFTIERIAGFNRRPRSASYDQAQPEHVVYRSWAMTVLPGLPPVPVRLTGEGSLGGFTLYLTSAVPGTPRPSMAERR